MSRVGSWLPLLAALGLAAVGLAAVGSGACTPDPDLESVKLVKSVTIAERVSFQVPDSFEVVQESPVHDFVVAQFMDEGRVLLGAYVGNWPSFPGSECTGEVSDRVIGGFAAREAQGKEATSCLKEILIDLGEAREWPRFVHVWLERASQSQVRTAEAIVRSIRWVE